MLRRKKGPTLRKKLATLDAWITGQRQDQSVTRSNVPLRQYDEAFSTDENDLTKFNPLAQWSSADIWHYIEKIECHNPLHDRGFISVGLTLHPRGKPIQHERAGAGGGRSNTEGMRPAWTEHHSYHAGLIR